MKHTQGEWRVVKLIGNEYTIESEIPDPDEQDEGCGIMQNVIIANVRGKNNAKIMAAAPDLLYNLMQCVSRLKENDIDRLLIKSSMAAIRRATE